MKKGKIIKKIDDIQCFLGTLVRGPKATVEKYIAEQLAEISIDERIDIGSGEILLKFHCQGHQIDCQSSEYIDLAIAVFTSHSSYAFLYVKKQSETKLISFELGELDRHNDYLKFWDCCPDECINQKYILSNCGEGVEFKYEPSEYIRSVISDNEINPDADITPDASFDYIDFSELCEGITFAVAGKLECFRSVEELVEEITDRGGNFTDTACESTDFVICNKPRSTSPNNKIAKKLNIPVISEEEFMERFAPDLL